MNDERIIELFGQVPYFADQAIEKLKTECEQGYFVTSSYWSDQASVNLLDVCGTMHPDYAGLTWRKFLEKGRRMEENLNAFLRNLGYYTDFIKRLPNMFYHKIGAQTFITEDGHHRTCIGKFYLYAQGQPYIHGVQLTESVIDWHFLEIYKRLQAVRPDGWQIQVVSEPVRREDGPGWKRDFFDIKIACSKREGGSARKWLWNREELEQELPALEASMNTPKKKPGFIERILGK